MGVCTKLKINLGELHYLIEDLQDALAKQSYDLSDQAANNIRDIMLEMREPIDWAVSAKESLTSFVKAYRSAFFGVTEKDSWGDAKFDKVLRDNFEIDIENEKIIAHGDIRPNSHVLDLPENFVIKGDFYPVEWLKIPDDIIVEGNAVLPVPCDDKLRKQLLDMMKRGQIKGHVVNAT